MTNFPNLAIFNPAPLVADSVNQILYATAYQIQNQNNQPIPRQTLLKANLKTGAITATSYSIQSTNTTLMVIPWMGLDRDNGLLFATRISETRNGNQVSNTAYLDVVNTATGTFKNIYVFSNLLSTTYGGFLNGTATIPLFDYKIVNNNPVIENWRFDTINLYSDALLYTVPINTSALTNNLYPANYTVINNMHYDNTSNKLIVAGNLNLPSYRLIHIYVGYLDPATGIVSQKYLNSFTNAAGEALIVVSGSAFHAGKGYLTMKLVDPEGDLTQAKLLTLDIHKWTVVALVPFLIADAYCIETIVFV